MSALQDRPVCFVCDQVIEHDWVFEAPCGHINHSSAVMHGICLMEWREHREEFMQEWRRRFRRMIEEMGGAMFEDDDD